MPQGDFLLYDEMALSWCLFASHLSNNLLITDIGLDRRLSDEEDHNAHKQRNDSNAPDPHHPLLIVSNPVQGPVKVT